MKVYPLSADAAFFQSLRDLDHQLFVALKAKPCPLCGGRLDTSNFPRKPRGMGENETKRFSLCCRREGCRHRETPLSLRFFGRKIYPAWVVILAVEYCQELGLSGQVTRQTISRWKNLWREKLSETHAFMRRVRAALAPGHPSCDLPSGLLGVLGFPARESWVRVLTLFCDAVF